MKIETNYIFPTPQLDKEFVTNGELALGCAAKLFEIENPGKQCIGFTSKKNEAGDGFVYYPVLIDKQ